MSLFSIETHGHLQPHVAQEWLLTNGLGGFAASSVVGCNTRRYHGLLCAATLPPVGRIMTFNRVGEILTLDDDHSRFLEFSVNQFKDQFHPRGDQYLRRFELADTAKWTYDVEGVEIVRELQLVWQKNIAGLRYTVNAAANRKARLVLMPFVSLRDFHYLGHSDQAQFEIHAGEGRVEVKRLNSPNSGFAIVDQGRFEQAGDWWYAQYYAVEAERGMDCLEDLYTPGRFVYDGVGPFSVTLWLSTEPVQPLQWDQELLRRRGAIASARDATPVSTEGSKTTGLATATQERLARAANDFIVYRKAPNGSDGCTVIAGYPWFADWGRDTMISLPGLFFTTGRFNQAKQVLGVFAEYVSQGMIPNRFDDYTNEPHYNTVDASLWFIHACFEYRRLSGDQKTFDSTFLPACKAILDGYQRGTRYHIVMDPADSLITQGDQSTQLTWMDAKFGDTAFTPRQGKAVEINALWYHALVLMGRNDLAARVRESFRKQFWISPFRGLCDVVNGAQRDQTIRPNQIFAVSLPNSPLTDEQQSAVVEVVRRELLTPMGLRTLDRANPGYRGQYIGSLWDRDGAYHNGAVWPWLIGPFLSAYLRVNQRSEAAISQIHEWLRPLLEQMETTSIGQISEIYDGDFPHLPRGCPAQAWSIAEVLRIATELKI